MKNNPSKPIVMRYESRRYTRGEFKFTSYPEMYGEILDLVARIDPMDLVQDVGRNEYSLEVYDIMVNWVF